MTGICSYIPTEPSDSALYTIKQVHIIQMRCLENLECSERKLHCSHASDNVELSHFPSFFSVCTQESTNSIQRLAMLEAAADPPAVGAADIVAPIAGP